MRIVSLAPSLTDIVTDLGASASLVGVTEQCELPPDYVLPVLGSAKAIQFELLQTLQPDLVLVDRTESSEQDLAKLQESFRVMSFEVRAPDQVLDVYRDLGRLLQAVDAAEKFKKAFFEEKKACRDAFENRKPVPFLLLLWKSPYVTVNFDTYISRLLEMCGGYNVYHPSSVREFPIEIKEMIAKNPKLLLLASKPFSFEKRHIKSFRDFRVFSKIPIELVEGRFLSCYGPRTVLSMRFFREVMLKMSGLVDLFENGAKDSKEITSDFFYKGKDLILKGDDGDGIKKMNRGSC